LDEKRVRQKLDVFSRALDRLLESLAAPVTSDLVYDAVIQRFESTYEAGWHLLQAVAEYKGGAEAAFPRDVFRAAAAGGLIPGAAPWIAMLNDRNLTSHVYDEGRARAIFTRVRDAHIQPLVELRAAAVRELGP
jgi:nucleotidyltransferase substrate binding protein (TIGR01987 family)